MKWMHEKNFKRYEKREKMRNNWIYSKYKVHSKRKDQASEYNTSN